MIERGRGKRGTAAGRLGKQGLDDFFVLVGVRVVIVRVLLAVVILGLVTGSLVFMAGRRVRAMAVVHAGELGNAAAIAEVAARQAKQLGRGQRQQDTGGQQSVAGTRHNGQRLMPLLVCQPEPAGPQGCLALASAAGVAAAGVAAAASGAKQ